MGLSSSSKTQTNKPIYSSQLEGAANTVTNTANAQLPKITSITDQLSGLVPSLMDKYANGDPTTNAAKAYNTDVLSGKYLDAGNPYLEQMVAKTNNNVSNQTSAALGTRGLTGGSAFADIVSRALANNETGLRYNDYNSERDRMATAAGQTSSLAGASEVPLSSILSILQAQQIPVATASGAGATVGGLLGQYQTTKQTSDNSVLGGLGSLVGLGTDIFGLGNKIGLWGKGN